MQVCWERRDSVDCCALGVHYCALGVHCQVMGQDNFRADSPTSHSKGLLKKYQEMTADRTYQFEKGYFEIRIQFIMETYQ